MAYIELNKLSKIYTMGQHKIYAADGISMSIERGEFVVILGPSGAGKTTVLNILGGMDTASSGEVVVDGLSLHECSASQLTAYRRTEVGFVFQFYNLLPNVTALENVELALMKSSPKAAQKVLSDVGLGDKLKHFPSQLSGGEQQRVSIARALAKDPKLLLCDEPTGALDDATGKKILKLLYDSCKKYDKTVIVITHNQAIAPMADRVFHLKDGKVGKELRNESPLDASQLVW